MGIRNIAGIEERLLRIGELKYDDKSDSEIAAELGLAEGLIKIYADSFKQKVKDSEEDGKAIIGRLSRLTGFSSLTTQILVDVYGFKQEPAQPTNVRYSEMDWLRLHSLQGTNYGIEFLTQVINTSDVESIEGLAMVVGYKPSTIRLLLSTSKVDFNSKYKFRGVKNKRSALITAFYNAIDKEPAYLEELCIDIGISDINLKKLSLEEGVTLPASKFGRHTKKESIRKKKIADEMIADGATVEEAVYSSGCAPSLFATYFSRSLSDRLMDNVMEMKRRGYNQPVIDHDKTKHLKEQDELAHQRATKFSLAGYGLEVPFETLFGVYELAEKYVNLGIKKVNCRAIVDEFHFGANRSRELPLYIISDILNLAEISNFPGHGHLGGERGKRRKRFKLGPIGK